MLHQLQDLIKQYYLQIIFFLSMTALVSSLYISEVIGLLPCELCWYQRILAYPIALISGIALLRGDKKVYTYILPMSIIGMFVAFYQYLLQKTDIADALNCSSDALCSNIQIELLGFITIPLLSFFFFTTVNIITVLMVYPKRGKAV